MMILSLGQIIVKKENRTAYLLIKDGCLIDQMN
jgi:hypothetical protein